MGTVNVNTLSQWCALCAAVCAVSPSWAFAHGDPIIVTAQAGKLFTNGNIFRTEFEQLGPLTYTDVPGYEMLGFQTGDEVSFEVVDHLWHWNAVEGVVAAPSELELRIEGKSPPFPFAAVRHNPAHIDGENQFAPGFRFETIDGGSSQHQHLLAYLFEIDQAPAGGYGIVLRVTSPSYETSPPFMIAFNQQLDALTFGDAVAELAVAAFTEPTPFPAGDFNHDRQVNALDIDLLYAEFGGTALDPFDLNADGSIDVRDAAYWVRDIVETEYGDVNLDGAVDIMDLNAVRNQFGAAGGWAIGDSDGSGHVDVADLNAVRNAFGFSRGQAVPEPDAWTIALLALAVGQAFRSRL